MKESKEEKGRTNAKSIEDEPGGSRRALYLNNRGSEVL